MNIENQSTKLFLIHGLFMHGALMKYLESGLEKCGYDVYTFSYESVGKAMSENANLLVEFVKQNSKSGDVCHFVGHSLGGLLIRLAYEISPELFTGKIVTLGTPHNGSEVAKRVAEDLYQGILGGSYENALDGELPEWKGEIPLGSLSGTASIGVGMIFNSLEKPNDGTVSVTETQLENQTDHIEMNLSHNAMLLSAKVVEQVDYFLKNEKFKR